MGTKSTYFYRGCNLIIHLLSTMDIPVPSLKLTFSPLKNASWKTFSLPFGAFRPIFTGERVVFEVRYLLVGMVACKNGGPYKMYLRLQKWRHFGYSISEGHVYVARNTPRMKGAKNTRTEWILFHEIVVGWFFSFLDQFVSCSPRCDFQKIIDDPYLPGPVTTPFKKNNLS